MLVTEEVMAEMLSGGHPAREEWIQTAINFSTGGFGDSISISPPAARRPARHNAHPRRCRSSHGRGVSDSLSGTGFLLDTSVLI